MVRHSAIAFERWGSRKLSPRRESPWQNPYAERLIGSIRRECLDHVIIFNERHLHRVLATIFNTITTPERISRSARTARGRVAYSFPPAAKSLPSPRLGACIIATSVEPLKGKPACSWSTPSNCNHVDFEQGHDFGRIRLGRNSAVQRAPD